MRPGISSAFQEIDVHNMTKVQAITAIDARLRKTDSSVYQLRVIHGFHSGTVLRDAVRAHYKNHPKVQRIELGMNPGETTLILREL
ncbi:MAG: Smr/MutS family protein [Oscillospiraceae bacterium]|nr:Smr/MutS family protein [Oscillospiraceae bacterium]